VSNPLREEVRDDCDSFDLDHEIGTALAQILANDLAHIQFCRAVANQSFMRAGVQ
jgi:hypothetical protein